MSDDYISELLAWRESADQSLQKEDGWLALIGLEWLSEGRNSLGSDPNSSLRIRADEAESCYGHLDLSGGQVTFEPSTGTKILIDGSAAQGARLLPDTSGEPTSLKHGELSFMLIQREQRMGLRIWDNSTPSRTQFPGRSWFPIDPTWKVKADYTAFAAPKPISIPTELGNEREGEAIGIVNFEWEEKQISLHALEAGNGALFLIFKDETNGKETYPAGRFMVSSHPQGEHVILDFNRSYNPPCAFTSYATCPLPPKENVLSIRVEAGERHQTS